MVKGGVQYPDWLIFDFEDAIRDVFDLENEGSLKLSARETLTSYLPFPDDVRKRYLLRINAVGSSPFEADIEFLKSTKKYPPYAVMLPKVETADDVMALEIRSPSTMKIIPLIESEKGVQNIDSILKSSKKIDSFCFGHMDYFLGKKRFPVPMTVKESRELADTITKLINSARRNNKEYIDMGYYYYGRWEDLKTHCSYLTFISKGQVRIGKLVMHPEQITILNNMDMSIPSEYPLTISNDHIMSKTKIRDYAKNIVKTYENRPNKTVGVCMMGDIILTPQLYILAKNYLKNDVVRDS